MIARLAAHRRSALASAVISSDGTLTGRAERFVGALAKHQGAPLVAVTHGTVLSVYLAERLGCDAHDLWRSLHMPDAFVLDTDGGLIERIS